MTVEDLFGLIVRLAGLTLIIFGLLDAIAGVATSTGLPLPTRYSVAGDFLAAAIWCVLGLILIVAADPITRLAYRRRRNSN